MKTGEPKKRKKKEMCQFLQDQEEILLFPETQCRGTPTLLKPGWHQKLPRFQSALLPVNFHVKFYKIFKKSQKLVTSYEWAEPYIDDVANLYELWESGEEKVGPFKLVIRDNLEKVDHMEIKYLGEKEAVLANSCAGTLTQKDIPSFEPQSPNCLVFLSEYCNSFDPYRQALCGAGFQPQPAALEPDQPEKKASYNDWDWLILILVVIMVIVVIGWFYYRFLKTRPADDLKTSFLPKTR